MKGYAPLISEHHNFAAGTPPQHESHQQTLTYSSILKSVMLSNKTSRINITNSPHNIHGLISPYYFIAISITWKVWIIKRIWIFFSDPQIWYSACGIGLSPHQHQHYYLYGLKRCSYFEHLRNVLKWPLFTDKQKQFLYNDSGIVLLVSQFPSLPGRVQLFCTLVGHHWLS